MPQDLDRSLGVSGQAVEQVAGLSSTAGRRIVKTVVKCSIWEKPMVVFVCVAARHKQDDWLTYKEVASVASKVISSFPDEQLLCPEQAITRDAVSGFESRECMTHSAQELIEAFGKDAEGEALFPRNE